ncbi:DeoR/GlpR family DNA-binding transcription regulator [Actinomadura vinacea]|uniref:Lactose phosphotransferase system repressor n=1 Tax=Actinomadura vinacea TaxID=115336 RepID=A0ABP5WFG1_9ACTN
MAELAEQTGCSEMTIRRDLDQLADQGVLRRVRGGAVSLLLRGEAPPFAMREREAVEIKQRIAAAVGALISDGESVILDSGTTALWIARVLAARRVTAIPLDLHSANALSAAPEVKLLLPGGQALPGTLSFTGYLAETSLRTLRVDTTVLAVCGLSTRHGLTAHELAEVPVKQAAMAAATRTIVVCDGSKFTRTGLGHVCPATDLDLVITDDTAPAEEIDRMRAAGVAVRLV